MTDKEAMSYHKDFRWKVCVDGMVYYVNRINKYLSSFIITLNNSNFLIFYPEDNCYFLKTGDLAPRLQKKVEWLSENTESASDAIDTMFHESQNRMLRIDGFMRYLYEQQKESQKHVVSDLQIENITASILAERSQVLMTEDPNLNSIQGILAEIETITKEF